MPLGVSVSLAQFAMTYLACDSPWLDPRRLAGPIVFFVCALVATGADARPEGPQVFCETYPEVPECAGQVVTCATCHLSTDPASWNSFGLAVLGARGEGDFVDAIPEALRAIEYDDADGDGVSNLDEILLGTRPGDERSVYLPPEDAPGSEWQPNPWYDVGNYDTLFALRRVMVLYCGQSPTWEQVQEFTALADDPDMQYVRLHEQLESCLQSPWWEQIGVRELADPKIKPIRAVGNDTIVEIGGFRVVLADYEWDYRLWRWIMTDDRDVRDLLLAQYHVIEDEQGQLQIQTGVIPDPTNLGQLAGGQPLQVEKRAGMITTQWFLMSNTMFSALPRTSAAQAYRAYLGMDISLSEGILPVPNEPHDVDDKGVAQAACANCHSTLDPLAYSFAYYTGIILPSGTGIYSPTRPLGLMDDWDPNIHKTVIFGQEVANLMEWAQVAVESDAFKRNTAAMFFEHALGHSPEPDEQDEFITLWQSIDDDGWSANQLIHRLVDTRAFGAP
jgi:hypothetical protein